MTRTLRWRCGSVPGLLGRIEGMLERAVEGGSRALFRNRLQPIELAKAAARAMERGQMIGPDGVEVPNAFTIAIHPTDLEQVAPYQAGLEGRIKRYLGEFAEQRGLIPVASISVHMVGDERLRRRAVSVSAQMADPGRKQSVMDAPPTRPVMPVAPTAELPRVRRSEPVAAPSRALALHLEDGRYVPLGTASLRIGRAPDNDLVISDSRVSRYHAQIVADRTGPHIRDLGSTNGTMIAGRPVSHDRLSDGDQLSLGGYAVQVRADLGSRVH